MEDTGGDWVKKTSGWFSKDHTSFVTSSEIEKVIDYRAFEMFYPKVDDIFGAAYWAFRPSLNSHAPMIENTAVF